MRPTDVSRSKQIYSFRYNTALEALLKVLEPGGHLIIGDHVGVWGLYRWEKRPCNFVYPVLISAKCVWWRKLGSPRWTWLGGRMASLWQGGGDPWPSWQSLNRIRILGLSQICTVTRNIARIANVFQCPTGTQTRPATWHFFDARPVPIQFWKLSVNE